MRRPITTPPTATPTEEAVSAKEPPVQKLRCHPRTPYKEEELPHQIACYPQFVVVPYRCPNCDFFHLLFVNR